MEFSMKDSYRAMVEAASGGRNTVMYDDFGNPNIMVCVPAYNMKCLGPFEDKIHPAFDVEGKEVSEIWIGKYPGSYGNGGVPISLPNANPILEHVDGPILCEMVEKKGAGWHQITNAEWAAIMCQSAINGFHPIGSCTHQNYGVAPEGVLADNAPDGLPVHKTGTSNVLSYHDGTAYGVADLIGYVWQFVDGIKVEAYSSDLIVHGYDGHPANMPFSKKYINPYFGYDYDSGKRIFDYTGPGDNRTCLNTSITGPFDELADEYLTRKGFVESLHYGKVLGLYPINFKGYTDKPDGCQKYNNMTLYRDMKGKPTAYDSEPNKTYCTMYRGGRADPVASGYNDGPFSLTVYFDDIPNHAPDLSVASLHNPRVCWVEYSRKYGE